MKSLSITVDGAPATRVASSGIDWDCPFFRARSAAVERRADGTCSPPTWSGTASYMVINAVSGDASVTWKVDPSCQGPPGTVGYYAEGSMTVVFQEYLDLGCTVSPTELTIGKIDGDINRLILDFTMDPPTYQGAGQVSHDLTINCPDTVALTIPSFPLSWWSDGGAVMSDGTVIHGAISNSYGSASYTFTRQ